MKKLLLLLAIFTAKIAAAQSPVGTMPAERGMICPTNNGLAKAWWQRANELFAAGDPEAAVLFFKKSIAADSNFCDPTHGLSILFFAMGKLDSAEIFARQAFSRQPDADKLKFNLASVLAARQQTEAAIPLLEDLSKSDFKRAESLELLAQMYLFSEKFEQAEAAAQASLAICEATDPALAGLNYLILGSAKLWQQQPAKAKPFFEKAQSLGVQVPETYRKAAGL